MDKFKRIMAIVGVVLLICMYLSTLVFAIMAKPGAEGMFKASIVTTIMVPILLYAYTMIYKLVKGKDDEKDDEKDDN